MNATDRFEFFLYSHTPEGGWISHDEAWEAWQAFEKNQGPIPSYTVNNTPREQDALVGLPCDEKGDGITIVPSGDSGA